MKPFDENDLIAYHLNELPLRQKKALEKAFGVDANLLAQSESIEETLRGFKGHSPFDLDPRLHSGLVEWNWKVLSPAMPRYPAAKAIFSRRRMPLFAGAGLAFAAVTVAVIKWQHTPAGRQRASHHLQVEAPTLTTSRHDASITPRAPLMNTPSEDGKGRQQRAAGLWQTPGTCSGVLHEPQATTTAAFSSKPAQVTASAVASPNLPATPFAALVTPAAPTTPVPGVSTSALVEPTSGPSAQVSAKGSSNAKVKHIAVNHDYTTDVTFAMGGTLIGYNDAATSGGNNNQGATHAVIAMASFHEQFRPAAGYRVALSYTRPDFHYGNVSSINGKIYEAAGTYVMQGPGKGRVSTSVEAGAGIMRILPTLSDSTKGNNTRVAGIFGVAADLMLSKRIGIHAAYRGQVFKGPDFQYSGVNAPITASTLLSHEPSLGITYRLSHR